MRRLVLLGSLALMTVGCAVGSGLPSDAERAIEAYYAAHASEKRGRCPAPFIDGFTRVEVVENSAERQVVDVRYLYGDRIKNSDSDRSECIGFSGRRFTLARTEAGIEVVEMSGPVRG